MQWQWVELIVVREMGCVMTLIRGSKGHVRRASWAPRTFFTFLARAKNVKTPPRGRAKNVKLSASTKTSPTYPRSLVAM